MNSARPGHPSGAASDLVFSCRDVSVDLPHQDGVRQILADISLELRRGEFLTVVGPSGTGKTTLLRVLGGLTAGTRGAVHVNGRLIAGPPADVVIVFQDYSHALLQWRTVARNVAFGLEGKLPRNEINKRVRDALRLVRLDGHDDDYPWQLSGGMQQRVQIARALALQPDVLMMDEPFGALDAMTKATMQDELLRVHERTGTSFVFITHDIEEAVYLGDRVVVLGGSPGRIHTTVSIGLPRPRDQIATRQSPEFLQHRLDIHAAVRESAGGDAHF